MIYVAAESPAKMIQNFLRMLLSSEDELVWGGVSLAEGELNRLLPKKVYTCSLVLYCISPVDAPHVRDLPQQRLAAKREL